MGGSESSNAVPLSVSKGLYSVLLGDTAVSNMTGLPVSIFTNPDIRLRVWFNDGVNGSQLLTPDQRLAPTPYLADGSVQSPAIAAGAVSSMNIAQGAINSTHVAPGSLNFTSLAKSFQVTLQAHKAGNPAEGVGGDNIPFRLSSEDFRLAENASVAHPTNGKFVWAVRRMTKYQSLTERTLRDLDEMKRNAAEARRK
jgi:hypothetical protein